MRILFAVAWLLIIAIYTQAQEMPINQIDNETGKRIGKWIEYYEDNKIKSIEYYTLPLKKIIPNYHSNFFLTQEDLQTIIQISNRERKRSTSNIVQIFVFAQERLEEYQKKGTSFTYDKYFFNLDNYLNYWAGLKDSTWQYFYPNGKISMQHFFQYDRLDSLLLYDTDGKNIGKNIDTYPNTLKIKYLYFEKDNKSYKYFDIFKERKNTKSYFFGEQMLIETQEISHKFRRDNLKNIKGSVELTSHSDTDIVFSVSSENSSYLPIVQKQIVLPARKSITYEFDIEATNEIKQNRLFFESPQGIVFQNIFFENNYLCTTDFTDWQQAVKEKELVEVEKFTYYLRKSGEALLKIYNYDSSLRLQNILNADVEDLVTIPISKIENILDFKGWKSGTYLFRIIDFNTKEDKFKLVKINQ
jgi:antitoxin component YwqK of YwqJK toxin-antitoxin module